MRPPNILVFMSDDHAAWACGFAGNGEVESPSLDRLAREGARLRNAFACSPVCSPARASFWTGLIPSAHGVHDHLADEAHPGLGRQANLAGRLQAAGYRTGLCGKWHGHATGRVPAPGFERWFSQWEGTRAAPGPQPFSDDGRRIDFFGPQAPIVAEAARRFLREDDDRPFFLFVGYTETHSPFRDRPERWLRRYQEASFRDVPDEPTQRERWAWCEPLSRDRPEFREKLANYYAGVSVIDEEVGRVLTALEETGEAERTLVLYTSDHGHMNGHHGLVGKGNATVPQNFFEESIRVPALVRWPGRIAAGRELAVPADHRDLHATLLEAAGAPPNAAAGCSLLDVLTERRPDAPGPRHVVVEYGNARMARSADGRKLIRRFPGPNGRFADEYYDLRDDPRELRNLIADPARRAEIAELDAAMDVHFARHARAETDGRRIAEQPRCNAAEPWRRA